MALFVSFLEWQLALALRYALFLDRLRRALPDCSRRWRGGLRKKLRGWLLALGLVEPLPRGAFARRQRRPWNRTPDSIEEQLVRLHVKHGHLGNGQLMTLAERVLGIRLCRETVRNILIRRREQIAALRGEQRRRKQKIIVRRPLSLWGVDLTLVWSFGFFPIWLLGIVDYHGSRLMVLERLRWPTTSEVLRVLDAATARHGCPARILSDNGSVFRSFDFELWLVVHGVDHTLTKPAHPWTNGRIERLFRTFKTTVFAQVRLLGSVAQIDRFCADFVTFYNRDRPHSSYGGKTPDEVWFGRPKQLHSSGRVHYFDGLFAWHRFG